MCLSISSLVLAILIDKTMVNWNFCKLHQPPHRNTQASLHKHYFFSQYHWLSMECEEYLILFLLPSPCTGILLGCIQFTYLCFYIIKYSNPGQWTSSHIFRLSFVLHTNKFQVLLIKFMSMK